MAKVAGNNTPAPLVPLEATLNFLYDGTALMAPLIDRMYDQKTLDSLRDRLAGIGARWRGEIDRGRPQWLEAVEWLDYQFAYETFSDAGNIIVTVSRQTYPAAEVKDHDFPVRSAGEPRYRLVVRNVKVDTAPLLCSRPAPGQSTAEKKHRAARQLERVKQALPGCFPPDGAVPRGTPTGTVRAKVAAMLATESKTLGLAVPSWDTVNRALGRGK